MTFCPECGSQMIYSENSLLCPYCSCSVCCCPDCNGQMKGVENVQSQNRTKARKKIIPLEAGLCATGYN